MSFKQRGIWQYQSLLPSFDEQHQFTLGEGSTPLVHSQSIGESLGLQHLYFKLEILNPSGSYKDRFAAGVVTELRQQSVPFCIATSSGNTGAALAAYCAASGIKCFMVVTDGAPAGKLEQMRVYGAETLMVRDFGLDMDVTAGVMEGLRQLCEQAGTRVQISAYQFSEKAMAGVQTIAYEIADQLKPPPAHVFSPAGGGGLTLALGKGFSIYKEKYPQFERPKLHCVQPEGNNTIAGSLRSGGLEAIAVTASETRISGLQVPNIIDGTAVVEQCRELGGTGYLVSDEAVFHYQEQLAKKEGIFCEPAGAVALAGLAEAVKNKEVSSWEPVVCVVTGHGFKDPKSTSQLAQQSYSDIFDQPSSVLQYLGSIINK